MVKVTYKGETRDIPKRYIPDSLSEKERKKQIKSIFQGTDRPKVDKKKRKSSWTIQFNEKYGDKIDKLKGGRSKKNIAKVTGIPIGAINEVFKKGEGAYYSSGSRPNQTASSWAYARVYAYIMGGKKIRKIEESITKKYKVKLTIPTEK
jgi:hypothetical protein